MSTIIPYPNSTSVLPGPVESEGLSVTKFTHSKWVFSSFKVELFVRNIYHTDGTKNAVTHKKDLGL